MLREMKEVRYNAMHRKNTSRQEIELLPKTKIIKRVCSQCNKEFFRGKKYRRTIDKPKYNLATGGRSLSAQQIIRPLKRLEI